MTVTTTTTRTPYTGNGATTAYSTVWYFTRADDVRVTVDDVVLTRGVHYEVSLPAAVDGAGVVTFLAAPANAAVIIIERRVALVQDTSYRTQGSYSRATQEDSMDRLQFQIQQVAGDVATLEAGGDTGLAGDVAALQSEVAALETTVAGHTTDITGLDSRVDVLEAASAATASSATPAAVAAAGAAGTSDDYSRADHAHAHGTQALGDGTGHAVATETTAGFASPELVARVNATQAEQIHIIDATTTDPTPTQVLTYTPTDNTFERVLVEAICTNNDATKLGLATVLFGEEPDNISKYFTGDGVTTVYTLPFYFHLPPENGLTVTVDGVGKAYGTDYTLTVPVGATLGFVTFAVAPGAGKDIMISVSRGPSYFAAQRVAGSTVMLGLAETCIRLSEDASILIDASSPLVRVRLRGGNFTMKWRVVLKRLVVALPT